MAGEWETAELGEVAAVRSGYAFKSSDWTASGIPVVKIANVKGGRLEMAGCSFVPEATAAESGEFQLRAGDILISMTGYIGDVARVRNSNLPCVLNQRVGKFSVRDKNRLDADFLYTFLAWSETRQTIENSGYGSAQPNVSPSLIHKVEIPLPPLPTQRAIAHVLGTLDDLIELNRETNEILEEMARALFKSWFVDFDPVRAKLEGRPPAGMDAETAKLFPDHFQDSELGQIPRGWEVNRWGDVATLEYGKTLRDYRESGGAYRVFGTNGPIGNHSEALCNEAGIVIGRKGAYRGVHYSPEPFFVIDTAFYLKPKKSIDLKWAYYELLCFDLNSMDSGSAIPSTSRDDFYGIRVALPPLEIQLAFGEIVSGWLAVVYANAAESRDLATLRDTLLPKLLSGDLKAPTLAP